MNLLYADGRATCHGFQFAAGPWDSALDGEANLTLGVKVYVIQMAHMFRQMVGEVEELVVAIHSQHIKIMNDMSSDNDEGLKKIYHAS